MGGGGGCRVAQQKSGISATRGADKREKNIFTFTLCESTPPFASASSARATPPHHLHIVSSLSFRFYFCFQVLLQQRRRHCYMTAMNGDEQIEVHYMDNGYSYPVSEGYVDFLGGAPAAPLNYLNFAPMLDQESLYWSMHMNSYKYGQSDPEGHYYGVYEDNSLAPRMDSSRRVWEYSSMANTEDPISVGIPSEQSMVSEVHSIPEEREPNDQDAASAEVSWQDDVDPDTMTYEELLDLGEAVGTQSRGLSQELIDLLPTSKHKSGGIFSRKKSEDRCVICQMRYKRGDRQINLPCKHAYHTHCGSKWLSINKTCPVCNSVVFGDDQHNDLTN